MEGEPLDTLAEHHAGCHEQLGKVERLDAFLLVLLELDARRRQQLDGVLSVHVLPAGHETRLEDSLAWLSQTATLLQNEVWVIGVVNPFL